MQFDILTLFPDLIHSYAGESILGRGQKNKAISIRAHNFRDFTKDKQRHVDDKPYGGGAGMILQVQPIYDCLKAIKALKEKNKKTKEKIKVIIMDPAGKKFDQRMAEKFAKLDRLVLIAGRYEGFDARVYKLVDERISVGEYVLDGWRTMTTEILENVTDVRMKSVHRGAW
jgi:tRNA (guanine37-N1)-methyltransferase